MSIHKLAIATALLLASSFLIILHERHSGENHGSANRKEFQRTVCGLGLGASLNPAWGFINYDPRVDTVDETRLWPIPGGYGYSPDRGLSVGDFREADWVQGDRQD